MSTLPDGSPSITNMYLWQPVAGAFYAPCVDGDFDAGVIGHEYGHMIENRMIGKGNRRAGHHAGAMGESTGDLMSIEQLNEHGNVPADGANRWATGTYATGEKLRGIRNYAAQLPVAAARSRPRASTRRSTRSTSPTSATTSPGPRSTPTARSGRATNFDVRRALAAKYDAQFPEGDQALQEQCARGEVPVDRCPGNRRWIQLLFDSYLLDPTGAVDGRRAQFDARPADTLRFGGANQAELWLAFARRGLGRERARRTAPAAAPASSPTPIRCRTSPRPHGQRRR